MKKILISFFLLFLLFNCTKDETYYIRDYSRNPMGIQNAVQIIATTTNPYISNAKFFSMGQLIYYYELPCTMYAPMYETLTVKFDAIATNFDINFKCNCSMVTYGSYKCEQKMLMESDTIWDIAERVY